MRVLVVGFADSIHLSRFLRVFEATDWDVRIFDADVTLSPHPELPYLPLYGSPLGVADVAADRRATVRQLTLPVSFSEHADRLSEVIEEFRPDILHSNEIQHAGALVHAALARPLSFRPAWLCTNWGSDISWFGRNRMSIRTIRSVVQGCDYYSAECHRDVALARAFGLRGEVVGVWPATAGIDLDHAETLRADLPPSKRRTIAVKGLMHTFGLGDHAFEAVARCADLLKGWEICSYYAEQEIAERFDRLAATRNLRHTSVSTLQRPTSHDDHLAMHGRSRVSLSLNRSDALSMSFVEAMAMGSFPVQSSTSCGNEVTTPGRGALFVSPLDVDEVTHALRRALTDDGLVESAARLNRSVCRTWLDVRQVRPRVLDAYERICDDRYLSRVNV